MELYGDGLICIDVVQLKDSPMIEVVQALKGHVIIVHTFAGFITHGKRCSESYCSNYSSTVNDI